MIKLEETEVYGWEAAIRGMRNPMNSWEKSDSEVSVLAIGNLDGHYDFEGVVPHIGEKDYSLMMNLASAGAVHAKYRRMIVVTVDIVAPLYWWKEFDTYKVGTVANSCSTMHKIHAKEFELEDFSFEHLMDSGLCLLESIVESLNFWRLKFVEQTHHETQKADCVTSKDCWWQMIQLLPSSYNQRRTVQLNYEVLTGIYRDRRNHKLDEWRDFCRWIEQLPYSEIITVDGERKNAKIH